MPPKSKSGKRPKLKRGKNINRKKVNRKALEQKIFKQIDNDLKKIDRTGIYAALIKDVEGQKVKIKSEIVNTGSVAFTPRDEDAKEQPKLEEADQYEDFDELEGNRSDEAPKKEDENNNLFKTTPTGCMNSIGTNPAPDGIVYKTECFIRSVKFESNKKDGEAKEKADDETKNIETKSDKAKNAMKKSSREPSYKCRELPGSGKEMSGSGKERNLKLTKKLESSKERKVPKEPSSKVKQ